MGNAGSLNATVFLDASIFRNLFFRLKQEDDFYRISGLPQIFEEKRSQMEAHHGLYLDFVSGELIILNYKPPGSYSEPETYKGSKS